MATWIHFIASCLGMVLICLLLGIGTFFTIRLRFVQFFHFSHMFSLLRNSRNSDSRGVSSFQALCTGLGARVGTGNIAGVALALTLGGPGAIFWMWVTALIGMATAFAESSLAQLYKTTDHQGNYCGGPAYYIEKGLGMRWLGTMFSIFLIIAYGWIFNAVQTNSISQAAQNAFGLDPLLIGFFLVILAATIIFGGNRTVARVTEVVVPFMAVGYLLLAAWIVITHLNELPRALASIFHGAFGWKEAGSGALGYTAAQAISSGIKRGLFSNEAGMGSAPNAAAAATPYPPHPASQGYVQMLGVFLDTMVICSATALIILCAGDLDNSVPMNGIRLTQHAFSKLLGPWGPAFVALAIFFFAFTAVVANYSYAEGNLIFLRNRPKNSLMLFRLSVLVMIFFGTLADVPLVWALADISMSLMAITNLTALLLLSGTVIWLYKDYSGQRRDGTLPTFRLDSYQEIKNQLEQGIWIPETGKEKS